MEVCTLHSKPCCARAAGLHSGRGAGDAHSRMRCWPRPARGRAGGAALQLLPLTLHTRTATLRPHDRMRFLAEALVRLTGRQGRCSIPHHACGCVCA